MEISLVASTNSLEDPQKILEFSKAGARVCYTKKDFTELLQENNTDWLIQFLLEKGHHSPYEHAALHFYIEGIPKSLAMVLNNEKQYVTSEKSARYTVMKDMDPEQKELYEKWKEIITPRITEQYPFLSEEKAAKLAQENARYMTSVETPTKMLHTLSFRQLNYIMHFFEDEIADAEQKSHYEQQMLIPYMQEFNEQLAKFFYTELEPKSKQRRLSFFAKRTNYGREWGENYSTTKEMSFAALAQAQRHRTLGYEVLPITLENPRFFVPPILQDRRLEDEWVHDLEQITSQDDYPQALLLTVHEYGNYTDFISKASERLCGNAQFETMQDTKRTLATYLKETQQTNPEVYSDLMEFTNGPKCTFPRIQCQEKCAFGSRYGIERLV